MLTCICTHTSKYKPFKHNRLNISFMLSLIGFILFFIIEKKSENPMLPLKLFTNKRVFNLEFFFILCWNGINELFVYTCFYFVQVEGMSELQSGLIISTLAIVSMLVTVIVTPIAANRGSSLVGSIGLLTFIVASYLFSQIDSNFTTWDYIWRLIIVGIGTGCTLAPYTTTTVLSVPIEKSGVAASICNISRTVGSIVGVAILVMFLNHQLLVEKEKINREVVTVIKKVICQI